MMNKARKTTMALALAIVMVLSTAGAASAASFYDSSWRFWEQHAVSVGHGGGSEPNDVKVKVRCYSDDDSYFQVKLQRRAWGKWWNQGGSRLIDCGETTTFWNVNDDRYRVIVQRMDSGPPISAKAIGWFD